MKKLFLLLFFIPAFTFSSWLLFWPSSASANDKPSSVSAEEELALINGIRKEYKVAMARFGKPAENDKDKTPASVGETDNDKTPASVGETDNDKTPASEGVGKNNESGLSAAAKKRLKNIDTVDKAVKELKTVTRAKDYEDGEAFYTAVGLRCNDLAKAAPALGRQCVEELERIEKLATKEAEQTHTDQLAQILELQKSCVQSHENVRKERNDIENAVQSLQSKMDSVDDQILQARSAITASEDNFRQGILNKQEQFRKEKENQESKIRNLKLQDRNLERDAIKTLSDREEARIQLLTHIKNTEMDIQKVCSDRFQKYIDASTKCYNEAIKTTKAERDEFNQKIQSGKYQVVGLSELLDLKNIKQKFQYRLQELHQQCYKNTVGENLPSKNEGLKVQVTCSLEALEKRRKSCEKIQNKSSACPQGLFASQVELETLNKLKSLDDLLKSSKRSLKLREQNIALENETMKDQAAEVKELIRVAEERLLSLEVKFEKEIQFEKNKLAHAKSSNQNNILRLEKERTRLFSQDPAKHFQESIWASQSLCCNPITPFEEGKENNQRQVAQLPTFRECGLLNTYMNDSSRWQFAIVQPLYNIETSASNRSASSGIR